MEKSSKDVEARNLAYGRWISHPAPEDEIVISGISGSFPESENIEVFKKNLYDKVDMVTEGLRSDYRHPKLPTRMGKIPHIEKFDPGYFGLRPREINNMEPATRVLLEKTVEALYDAGVHPSEIEGTRTAIFAFGAPSDSHNILFKDLPAQTFALMSIPRYNAPHRIAYHLKVNGPATFLDSGCSSGIYALQMAFEHIRRGTVENAIILGGSVMIHPFETLRYGKLGVLSPDGSCKPFDLEANGYVRSEAAFAAFLQKTKNARRNYGRVVHVVVRSDGFKERTILRSSGIDQMMTIEDLYRHCDLEPDVDFLEAHGTGTKSGDVQEALAIRKGYCKNRSSPLIAGSIKSCIGHTEYVSGMAQLAKIVFIFQSGLIPPSLYPKKLKHEGMIRGEIEVPTHVTRLSGKTNLIALSSYGFGGAISHALFERPGKTKCGNALLEDAFPRLVCISGRTEEAVTTIIDRLKEMPLDYEFVTLFHHAFRFGSPTHQYRAFSIISKEGELSRSYSKCSVIQEPKIFIIFGNIDTTEIGVLKNPLFTETILRVEQSLSSAGLGTLDRSEKNKVLLCLCLQLALHDLLIKLELIPSSTYGFGNGEIADCYMKNNFSFEHAILLAYCIGEAFSYTSGNPDKQKCVVYMTELIKSNKVLKTELDRYIKPDKKGISILIQIMNKMFELQKITLPENHVVLEIGNVQTICEDNQLTLHYPDLSNMNGTMISPLQLIGSLYMLGVNPNLAKIYPKIEFPVSRETHSISPMIRWDHSEDWNVEVFTKKYIFMKNDEMITGVDIGEETWSFLDGHLIDDKILFPAAGYIFVVWEAFSLILDKKMSDTRVVLEDVHFWRALPLENNRKVDISTIIRTAKGEFQICANNTILASGRIRTAIDDDQFMIMKTAPEPENLAIDSDAIYREFNLRGYHYSGLFKGLDRASEDMELAYVRWSDSWVAFMDCMLQHALLQFQTRNLYVPTYIGQLILDGPSHMREVASHSSKLLPGYCVKEMKTVKCGGIQIKEAIYTIKSKHKNTQVAEIEKCIFVPNITKLALNESIRVNMQIVTENNSKAAEINVVRLIVEDDNSSLDQLIVDAVVGMPHITALNITPIKLQNLSKELETLKNIPISLVIGTSLIGNSILETLSNLLTEETFLLSKEPINFKTTLPKNLEVITEHTTTAEMMLLIRKSCTTPASVIDLSVPVLNLRWLKPLQDSIRKQDKVILYANGDEANGILGLSTCIQKEIGADKLNSYLMLDGQPFSMDDEFCLRQMRKGLALNVHKNGQWGTYRHLHLEKPNKINSRFCAVSTESKGNLSTLQWTEEQNLQGDQIGRNKHVNVYYSAITKDDLDAALGSLKTDTNSIFLERKRIHGLGFSGKDHNRNPVMGISASGTLATVILPDKEFLTAVPQGWNLEEAASIPVAYGTALYALFSFTRIRHGQHILIHGGTGSVEQAAIHLALYYKMEVYITVDGSECREYIKDCFPQMPESRIFSSKDTSFERQLRRATLGKGVDIVFNCLRGEKLQSSLSCLSNGGTFINLSPYTTDVDRLHFDVLKRNISCHSIKINELLQSPKCLKTITKLLQNAIGQGIVKPLHRIVFGSDKLEKAYRHVQASRSLEQVLIQIRKEDADTGDLECAPKYWCDPKGSYVVVGGLGGIGLEFGSWLVDRGAKNLVVATRSGILNGHQRRTISNWRCGGCEVIISNNNVCTSEGCEALLRQANNLAPVMAIFNLAGTLFDARIVNQTVQKFTDSLKPKAVATKHLDEASRNLCPHLRDFVIFSSVSCGRGCFGQPNYGMGNSIMERICEIRKREGYPALAIQYGSVNVGMAVNVRNFNDKTVLIAGSYRQEVSGCLAALDHFLKQDEVIVACHVAPEKIVKIKC